MSPQCASSSDTVREIKYQILHLSGFDSEKLKLLHSATATVRSLRH
jgi:hypothetical protein